MHDQKKRLVWAVLAALLPGPWTPVIVLAYVLGRAADQDQDTTRDTEAPSCPPPDPYACVPVSHGRNRYAPAR
ncbi:hypothetical protein [Amycolatopsis rubida]|uniref:Uncharacterized protein n=1 Tax=Amycolatopsis rubida TaxID=112413 RepID=A0A1I5E092_9PSEU|nr:hypothetical protein [Amycolatopsis rubida]SFO04866.1 hypothetical protein SAMN05421854_101430 [Amycolatopsis rubida]